MDEIVNALRNLGFREYEAKVYAALIVRGELTASEIHKVSGVPRTKVYEVLRNLEDKGFVEVIKSSPASFRAIDPEMVLEDYKQSLESSIQTVISAARSRVDQASDHPVWCVRGVTGVRNRARAIVASSRELVVITSQPKYVERVISVKKPETKLIIVTDRKEKFERFEAEVREIRKEFSFIFDETVIGGVRYRFEGLMIADGCESFGVYRAGDDIIGVSIKLPLIIAFHRMIFLGLLTE